MKRRNFLVLLGLIAINPAMARPKRQRVLLVCQYGSVKSAITRELMRKRAADRAIDLDVSSRGITPEAHIDPGLLERLSAAGINPARDPLKKLSASDTSRANIVVIFDDLPVGHSPRTLVDWRDTGSFNTGFAAEQPRLMQRIDRLLDSIAAR